MSNPIETDHGQSAPLSLVYDATKIGSALDPSRPGVRPTVGVVVRLPPTHVTSLLSASELQQNSDPLIKFAYNSYLLV